MVGKYALPPEMDLTEDEVFGPRRRINTLRNARDSDFLPWEKDSFVNSIIYDGWTTVTPFNDFDSNISFSISSNNITDVNSMNRYFTTLYNSTSGNMWKMDGEGFNVTVDHKNMSYYVTYYNGDSVEYEKAKILELWRKRYKDMPFSPPCIYSDKYTFEYVHPRDLKSHDKTVKSINPVDLIYSSIDSFNRLADEMYVDDLKYIANIPSIKDRYIDWFRQLANQPKHDKLPWEEVENRLNTINNVNTSIAAV